MSCPRRPRSISLLAAVSLAGSLAAQDPETRPAPAPGPTVVKAHQPVTVALGQTFSLAPGEHDLVELVEKAATVLGRNILWQPTERPAKNAGLTVTLNNPVKVTPSGFEELLGNLLYAQGLAIVPIDADKGFFEVIALQGPRGREIMSRAPWRTPEEIQARPQAREYAMTSVRLKHINASICTNALRPFFMSSSQPQIVGLMIGNVGNQEAMVLAGFTDQLCAALRLIRECDQEPVQPPDFNQPGHQNALAALQAQIKALQEQVAELQKAAGIAAKK